MQHQVGDRLHFSSRPRLSYSFAYHSILPRQSDDGPDRSFGGSNGAIALYVIFGIIVLAVVFTSIFRSHRGHSFSARPTRTVYQNQPTPWNPSSFSHHRGMSQSSRDPPDSAFRQDQRTGREHGTSWGGRLLSRMTPRGSEQVQPSSYDLSNHQRSRHSAWPSTRQDFPSDSVSMSVADRWARDTQVTHVAVPPAYHRIVADKPPEFQGAPPEYFEEIDLEAQRTGQAATRGSPSIRPSAGTGLIRSEQVEAHQLGREAQDTNHVASSTEARALPEEQGGLPAANRP